MRRSSAMPPPAPLTCYGRLTTAHQRDGDHHRQGEVTAWVLHLGSQGAHRVVAGGVPQHHAEEGAPLDRRRGQAVEPAGGLDLGQPRDEERGEGRDDEQREEVRRARHLTGAGVRLAGLS